MPALPARPDTAPLPPWLGLLLALASALLLRASLGYRPFPSIDDYIYIPLAWASADPGLYGSDLLLQGQRLHSPVWPFLVSGLEASLGLATGLWLLTLLLSLATFGALWQLCRRLGGSGVFLPLTCVIALGAQVQGLGRGQYDGLFGNAFHMQWLALVLVLWAYEAWLRPRSLLAGTLLGLACIAHPVVALHGAAVVAASALALGRAGFRPLALTGLATALVSAPVSLPLAWDFLLSPRGDLPSALLVEQGYLFRTPQEFILIGGAVAIVVTIAALGLAATAALLERQPGPQPRAFLGLLLGQAAIAALAIAFHLGEEGQPQKLWPYLLHLTRTTPLLLGLSAVALAAALEQEFLGTRQEQERSLRLGWIVFWVLLLSGFLTLLLSQPDGRPGHFLLMLLGLITVLAARRLWLRPVLAALWGLAGLGALGFFVWQSELTSKPGAGEAALFAWAQAETEAEALFILPPGFEKFRFHARRSGFVDFKGFPASEPALIPEWRRRLELVARPDGRARQAKGWKGIAEWDRSYANFNTPARIAELLQETRADYFVWDAEGLLIPPFLPHTDSGDPRLETAFRNGRFLVYRLKGAPLGG